MNLTEGYLVVNRREVEFFSIHSGSNVYYADLQEGFNRLAGPKTSAGNSHWRIFDVSTEDDAKSVGTLWSGYLGSIIDLMEQSFHLLPGAANQNANPIGTIANVYRKDITFYRDHMHIRLYGHIGFPNTLAVEKLFDIYPVIH